MAIGDDIIPEVEERGRYLGRALKLAAYLLLKWVHKDSGRGGLGDITFDKLCLILYLLWNHLHAKGIVGFRIPFEVRRGRHGRGCTVRKYVDYPSGQRRSLPAYLPKILEDINFRLPKEKRLFQRVGGGKYRGIASAHTGLPSRRSRRSSG